MAMRVCLPSGHPGLEADSSTEELRQTMKDKLLKFIDTTDHYETGRIFGLLPSEGEAAP